MITRLTVKFVDDRGGHVTKMLDRRGVSGAKRNMQLAQEFARVNGAEIKVAVSLRKDRKDWRNLDVVAQ